MNRSKLLCRLLVCLGFCLGSFNFLAPVSVTAGESVALAESERIVLLGNTFVEREQEYGQVELALRLAFPEKTLEIRNLGWSGDNVHGESRAYFGPVSAGYKHIQEYVDLIDPTLVLVSYGHNVAFEGPEQLQPFLAGYGRLLDDLKKDGRRIVVLGLTPLEPVYRPADEVRQLNEMREEYNAAIAQMAEGRGLAFVDLFQSTQKLQQDLHVERLTDNGVHLNSRGYGVVAEAVVQAFGDSLLHNGEYLLFDSQFQSVASPLREAILRKNELFFHRFRPQNETYLRGFRKHEQGQNAKEIYEFDPLVEAAEKKLQPQAGELMRGWLTVE